MKTLAYLSIVILLCSCSDENTSQKSKTKKNHSEEDLIDPDAMNDTALLMSLFPEDGTETKPELEIEEEFRDLLFSSEWYEYLLENYDTISPSNKVIGSIYGEYDICLFEQLFENGLSFEYIGCSEGGATENISFPGFTKEDIYNIINSNFSTEDNTWNEDSTSYEADDAGCYYSIENKNDTLFVSTYCGC